MFTKKLEEIFTPSNLQQNSKNKDINFKKLSNDIIESNYIPKPFKRVEIPKNNGEFRPIAIENEIDKIVSKTLYLALNEFFNPLFSNKSYGYRPNKGTLKAIKRVKDFIKRKYIHIFKSDINDFFETIYHDRLLNLLDIYIEDKRIIRLISLFLKSGIIKNDYYDHHLGIHQGDVLSPLLSNIYLHQFDSFLERENIEFVDFAYNPYALLVSHNLAYPKTALKQLQILNSDKRIEFAKEFVRAKVTNQKNYLKYLHKYHKNLENEITLLKKYIRDIKNINSIEKLLGYEGISANAYWQGIAKVLKEDDFKRITKGAKDTINSAFNYGYALLYHKVQSALIKAGLGINISFLHSLNKKPVLVFDMVEEFRTFIVDRTTVFALNKSDDIKVDIDGRLTKEAKKRIIEEVNERMASLHIYKKEKRKKKNGRYY